MGRMLVQKSSCYFLTPSKRLNMATWKYTEINVDGRFVKAQAPIIVSASRSTDIPAFYADWFFKRLEIGYSAWTNPFKI